jgi:hypothetical protein
MTDRRLRLLIVAMVAAGGLVPIVAYGIAMHAGATALVPDSAEPVPFRASPWYEQWSLFLTGYVVKPAYMLLSLALIFVLRQQRAPDLAALRWGMSAFLAGEAACAVNYVVFTHGSHLAEFLHSYGMVVAFAFLTYAALEGFDLRILHVSALGERCAFLPLCPACGKTSGTPCGLRRIFKYLILAFIATSLISFCASPKTISYDTKILLSAYNFCHPVIYQLFEIRYCPVLAIILFALSYVALVRSEDPTLRLPKILFGAGMGAFMFGVFRLILFQMFADNLVWFNTWEEITEFLLIAGLAYLLFIFRHSLLERGTPDSPA